MAVVTKLGGGGAPPPTQVEEEHKWANYQLHWDLLNLGSNCFHISPWETLRLSIRPFCDISSSGYTFFWSKLLDSWDVTRPATMFLSINFHTCSTLKKYGRANPSSLGSKPTPAESIGPIGKNAPLLMLCPCPFRHHSGATNAGASASSHTATVVRRRGAMGSIKMHRGEGTLSLWENLSNKL